MKIKNVSKDSEYYLIFRDDGFIFMQRRFCQNATDNPLNADEETIIALCDKLCPPSTAGGD